MQIVGITGQIGHGKSTFAELLADCCGAAITYESGQLVMDVANAWQQATQQVPQPNRDSLNAWIGLLPSIVAKQLHAETDETMLEFTSADEAQDPAMFEKLYQYVALLNAQPNLLQRQVTLADKELFRPLLQWIGGYFVKMIGPGIFYDEIVRRIQADAADAELAIVNGLRFPGDAERLMAAGGIILLIERPNADSLYQTDPTERERITIPYQVTIRNNGSLAELATVAQAFKDDLGSGQVKAVYEAAPSPKVDETATTS